MEKGVAHVLMWDTDSEFQVGGAIHVVLSLRTQTLHKARREGVSYWRTIVLKRVRSKEGEENDIYNNE